jgi:hypothetical protein
LACCDGVSHIFLQYLLKYNPGRHLKWLQRRDTFCKKSTAAALCIAYCDKAEGMCMRRKALTVPRHTLTCSLLKLSSDHCKRIGSLSVKCILRAECCKLIVTICQPGYRDGSLQWSHQAWACDTMWAMCCSFEPAHCPPKLSHNFFTSILTQVSMWAHDHRTCQPLRELIFEKFIRRHLDCSAQYD